MGELLAKQSGTAQAVEDLTGTTVGRFAVRSRLGAGGMGEVYRADDTRLKRPVALKRLSPNLREDRQYRQRLLKEAQRTSALNHLNIASMYDVLEEKGEVFLVMEYVEGETLRQRLEHPMDVESFLPIASQIVEALTAAHEKGIVHHDIKPGNIMLRPDGIVKVLDFGVARRLPSSREGTTTFSYDPGAIRTFAGTLSYAAPEVLLEKEADGRADIFSLGIVFYEALSGQHPLRGSSHAATIDRILHENPPPPSSLNPQISPELDRVVGKMLAKNPEERYSTAHDLLVDLRALKRSEAVSPETPSPLPVPAWWVKRALPMAVGVFLVVLLAAIPRTRETLQQWVGVGVIPAQIHIVVLPFVNVGDDPANQAFCDGLTYILTSKLTQFEGFQGTLLVVPASDVMQSGVQSVEMARQEFGVSLVLTGSVQRTGEKVLLSINLVDADSRRQLRSLILERSNDDLAMLQSTMAVQVAQLFGRALEPQEEKILATSRTGVAQAYDYYVQGRGYLQHYEKPKNIDHAITEFRQALALDAGYALAYAGLGEAYWEKYKSSKTSSWVAKARVACEQALTLDAELAAGHTCLGTLYNGTGQHEKAIIEFQRALEREPRKDDSYRGLALAYESLGKPEAAEGTYRKAIELRPQYWASYNWLGVFYARRARYAEAAEMFEQVVKLNPDNALGYSNLGGVYHLLGRSDDAIAMNEKSLSHRPNYRAYSNLATLYFGQQLFAKAARTYEAALEIDDTDYRLWGNLAMAYQSAPGEEQKAGQAYREAILRAEKHLRVNPHDAMLLGDLAEYYIEAEEREKARNYISRALRAEAVETEVFFAAALVYERLGERDIALKNLRQALVQGYPIEEVEHALALEKLREDVRYQRMLGER